MKVLCIGHATFDMAFITNEYPKENEKYTIEEKMETGGGQAANEACLLAKWGAETYFAGAVGSDTQGEKIKKELNVFGVKSDYLETSFDKNTSVSFIIINKSNGSRTIFNIASPDSSPHIQKEGSYKFEPDVILIDGYEYHASVAAINKFPNAISIIDAGKPSVEVKELAKLCKYVVASKNFAENIANVKIDFNDPKTLVTVYQRVKERYPNSEVIITLEEMGALYVINKEIKVMPGLKVDVVDTTGAGDVFHGAFVYALGNRYDIEKCITFANIAAGLSCKLYGGRQSIPSLNDVITYYNDKFGVQNATEPSTQA